MKINKNHRELKGLVLDLKDNYYGKDEIRTFVKREVLLDFLYSNPLLKMLAIIPLILPLQMNPYSDYLPKSIATQMEHSPLFLPAIGVATFYGLAGINVALEMIREKDKDKRIGDIHDFAANNRYWIDHGHL